ncbi:hypothetical protein ACWCV9_18565 [Streptomyces sp. NPDC001606]
MREITGVRATPGGRVAVRFHEHGYVVGTDRRGSRIAERLLGDEAGCVTVLVLVASAVLFGLLRKAGAPPAAVTACLWVFVASLCYALLLALLRWAADALASLLLVLFVVVTLPGLLFPGYRRRVLRGRRGGPETEPGWVPGAALAGVWHQADPRTGEVVTVQRTDGFVTAFVPPPGRARDLYDGFDALIRRHRPAAAPYGPGRS